MNQYSAITLSLLALITYSQNVKPILDTHCIECHAAGATLDLSRFPFKSKTTNDQPTIVDKILGKLEANPPFMPPGHRPKLDASEVELIQQWRNDGLQP